MTKSIQHTFREGYLLHLTPSIALKTPYLCRGLLCFLGLYLAIEYNSIANNGGKVTLPITSELYRDIFFNMNPKSNSNHTKPN